ncbi:MAG TPA: PF20097 family protein [Thermodesulfobacteriota bacterium]|nr:PF20097 family protein [Thermodesulfobacteriota bacterium]
MKNKSELIVPALVILLLAGVALWAVYSYAGDYLDYERLYDEGREAVAVVVTKGVERDDGRLSRTSVTDPSDIHRVIVAVDAPRPVGEKPPYCSFTVSKLTYDVLVRRDKLVVSYLPSDPSVCTLPDSLSASRTVLMSMMAVAGALLLLAAGFTVHVYRSFRDPDPGNPVKLTTGFDLPPGEPRCPRCGGEMTEGYIPSSAGIPWRDRNDPVGMPTIASGLPGTKSILKRPRLHAYRCPDCNIVTFKYGGGSSPGK